MKKNDQPAKATPSTHITQPTKTSKSTKKVPAKKDIAVGWSHPCQARGSLLKVEGVLRLAASDATFRAKISANPLSFLKTNGILLTLDERQALFDVLRGTHNSVFAVPPAGSPFDKMSQLRALWTE